MPRCTSVTRDVSRWSRVHLPVRSPAYRRHQFTVCPSSHLRPAPPGPPAAAIRRWLRPPGLEMIRAASMMAAAVFGSRRRSPASQQSGTASRSRARSAGLSIATRHRPSSGRKARPTSGPPASPLGTPGARRNFTSSKVTATLATRGILSGLQCAQFLNGSNRPKRPWFASNVLKSLRNARICNHGVGGSNPSAGTGT